MEGPIYPNFKTLDGKYYYEPTNNFTNGVIRESNSPEHIWRNRGPQKGPISWAARFSTNPLSSRPPACTVFSGPHPRRQLARGRPLARPVQDFQSCPTPPPHPCAADNSSSNKPPRPSHRCPRMPAPLRTADRTHH